MKKNPAKRGEYRLKAIPAMALAGSNSLAISNTVVEAKTDPRGGLVTFGVDQTRINKLLTGDSIAVCFVIDLKEWDEMADQIELDEFLKDNPTDPEPKKMSLRQQIRAAVMSTGHYTNVKVGHMTHEGPQTLGGLDTINIEVLVKTKPKSRK